MQTKFIFFATTLTILSLSLIVSASELFRAVKKDDASRITTLLSNGANPNELDDDLNTSLHVAAEEGSLNAVSVLLNSKIDINRINKDGETAFSIALCNQKADIARLLLSHGAQPFSINHDGQYSFECAVELGDLGIGDSIMMHFLPTSINADSLSLKYPKLKKNITSINARQPIGSYQPLINKISIYQGSVFSWQSIIGRMKCGSTASNNAPLLSNGVSGQIVDNSTDAKWQILYNACKFDILVEKPLHFYLNSMLSQKQEHDSTSPQLEIIIYVRDYWTKMVQKMAGTQNPVIDADFYVVANPPITCSFDSKTGNILVDNPQEHPILLAGNTNTEYSIYNTIYPKQSFNHFYNEPPTKWLVFYKPACKILANEITLALKNELGIQSAIK